MKPINRTRSGELPGPMKTRCMQRCIGLVIGIVIALAIAPRASGATPYPGGQWEPGPAQYGSQVVEGVPVAMDDGVVLNATVAYPTDLATGARNPGRFPVVVEYTPYITATAPGTGRVNAYFATYGYISVRVPARGTVDSPAGEFRMGSRREQQDGAQIVRWAAEQLGGSDGRVALLGCSFPGWFSLLASSEAGAQFGHQGNPLKAVVTACMGVEGVARQGHILSGVPTQRADFWSRGGNWRTPATEAYIQSIGKEIVAGGDAAYAGRSYWQERLPLELAQKIADARIPMLLWSGWRDEFQTAIHTYVALQNATYNRPLSASMRPHQPTTPRYQIMVGDWTHAQAMDNGIVLQWFETWLKGLDTGIQDTKTPMHLFERGTGRWVNAAQYPIASRYTTWHLDAGNALSTTAPSSASFSPLSWGLPDQAANVLSFTTSPLTDGATLAGPASATLYASSSNTNLMFIASLFDVAPDGSALRITRGVVVGSLRRVDPDRSWTDSADQSAWPYLALVNDSYLVPNQIYRVDIPLDAAQYAVQPGHRLRLTLTTRPPAVNCGEGLNRPGPGHDPCYLTAPQQATIPGGVYSIFHGPSFRSGLNLPQLPYLALPQAACAVTPTVRGQFCMPQEWGDNKQPH